MALGGAWLAAFSSTEVGSVAHAAAQPGPVRVAVFSPEGPGDPFWARSIDFMEAAARDLGLTLEVHFADGTARTMAGNAERIMTGPTPPDYVLFPATDRIGPSILDIAEREGINAVLLNTTISEDQRDRIKGPRAIYTRWLGGIIADDLLGGYLLARNMFRHAQRRWITAPSGRIEVIGLTHSAADKAALDRIDGLKLASEEYYLGDIAYLGLANGSKAKAHQVIELGYESHPGATLYWSTDDMMALGMMESLTDRTRRLPGTDAIIGGFYWSPWALQAVLDGRISFLMGGHFMTGGAALVMIHDHARGVDFKPMGMEQRFGFGMLHAGNIKQLAPILAQRDWSWVDFKRFSRALHPERGDYGFSASAFLRARKP
ncbi:ABC transporter substrate-binding protein [Marivibrio halodurans]|uniref:ABC transporter substrate-binding protein n=1 Tax=Marivibrio halodurans TaxID=2039722 RepID=A0A8J7V5M0_9PROT|nr:ABC transporter substrate-binding protein [Marivibrio halodurans]MBP5859114.1 ABC transporter substrate-binding protein [Marivibrio halodurans]